MKAENKAESRGEDRGEDRAEDSKGCKALKLSVNREPCRECNIEVSEMRGLLDKGCCGV